MKIIKRLVTVFIVCTALFLIEQKSEPVSAQNCPERTACLADSQASYVICINDSNAELGECTDAANSERDTCVQYANGEYEQCISEADITRSNDYDMCIASWGDDFYGLIECIARADSDHYVAESMCLYEQDQQTTACSNTWSSQNNQCTLDAIDRGNMCESARNAYDQYCDTLCS